MPSPGEAEVAIFWNVSVPLRAHAGGQWGPQPGSLVFTAFPAKNHIEGGRVEPVGDIGTTRIW